MKTNTLNIAVNVQLKNNAVTQKLAWIGTSGGGKTYGAMRLAEEFYDQGAQFVTIDPVGVWYGLRLDESGKKPSNIAVPVFGGLHGDIPLESTSGKVIADLVVDKDLTVILDVSQFESDAEKARFVADFQDRFFFRKKAAPSAVHIFYEECQEFFPQNPQRGEERMLHAGVRLQKIGRNFGIGTSLITQRPQEVSKKALNLAGTLFAFRTTGSHERKAIELWMSDNSVEEKNLVAELPSLETGQPHLWSPEWLKISRVVKILKKRTFDASSTPKLGARAVTRHLADIDLEKIRADVASTIEKAKSEDPKLLREQIARLEKQVAKGNAVTIVPFSDPKKTIDREVARAVAERDKEWQGKVFDMQGEWLEQIQNWFKIMTEIGEAMKRARAEFPQKYKIKMSGFKMTSDGVSPAGIGNDTRHKAERLAPRGSSLPSDVSSVHSTPASRTVSEPNGDLTGPEQRVLDGIAWMNAIGVAEPVGDIVAFLAGYGHVNSKGFTVPRGALRVRELITYPSPGKITLTEAGRALANAPTATPSTEELHKLILERLDGPKRRLLEPLLKAYPDPMSADELCQAAGYSHSNSKGFTVPRGKLKTFGLVEYPTPGRIRASDVLFPRY